MAVVDGTKEIAMNEMRRKSVVGEQNRKPLHEGSFPIYSHVSCPSAPELKRPSLVILIMRRLGGLLWSTFFGLTLSVLADDKPCTLHHEGKYYDLNPLKARCVRYVIADVYVDNGSAKTMSSRLSEDTHST